jgi:hypothetical protein
MVQRSAAAGFIRLAHAGAAIVLLALVPPRTSGAQVAVVVNPSNKLEELSLDKLRRLYLGQARTFPAAVTHASASTPDRPRSSIARRLGSSPRSSGRGGWR